jgi:hypothetical protein
MKGRIIALAVALALASAGTAGATTFTQHVLCGASCGALSATNGAGTLRLSGNGTTYGSVGSGTIVIKSLSRSDFQVTGAYSRRPWTKNGFTHFSGTNLSYFLSSSSWTLKIYGNGGIVASATAKGHGYIKGSGRWSHNGQLVRSWPAAGQTFTLSS